MSDKVKYSIVQGTEGNIAVQSTIRSFNLDHVTEKDIVSFYNSFSQYSAWDTGLLPVEGSGILSIRTAGVYTQFAYQHKPGLYHVNWAATEGGAATSYYVAQPYRIIICDMKDGNLLGARMFYSPYPITHPSQPLYHVNLPNINCKGYRNNGVGWICLYQNEDWSHLPLNERIVRFIERCSGVETYNDANMSETDGTRFYCEKGKPSYIWKAAEWQEKSAQEGYEWTLDEELWIPVLVKSMDDQKHHYDKGVNLTFADALVGDYRAYYYDDETTKPINAIIRPDKSLDPRQVLSYFVNSYNASTTSSPVLLNNTFASSQEVKNKVGSSVFTGSSLLNAPENHTLPFDDSENSFKCETCGEFYNENVSDSYVDFYDNTHCESCFNEYYVYVESVSAHFHIEDERIFWDEYTSAYYHSDYDTIELCENCNHAYCKHGHGKKIEDIFYVHDLDHTVCTQCIETSSKDNNFPIGKCFACNKYIPLDHSSTSITKHVVIPYLDFSSDQENAKFTTSMQTVYLCLNCAEKNENFVCPCGNLNGDKGEFGPCEKAEIPADNVTVEVYSCCTKCKLIASNPNYPEELIAVYNPYDLESFKKFHNLNVTNPNNMYALNYGFEYSDHNPF